MSRTARVQRRCSVCNKDFPARQGFFGAAVRDSVAERILRDPPDWSADAFICHADLSRYNTDYIESLSASERGELSFIEQAVVSLWPPVDPYPHSLLQEASRSSLNESSGTVTNRRARHFMSPYKSAFNFGRFVDRRCVS